MRTSRIVVPVALLFTLGAAALQAVGLAIGFGGSPWLARQPPLEHHVGDDDYWLDAGNYYGGAVGFSQFLRLGGDAWSGGSMRLQEIGGVYFWSEADLHQELMTPQLISGGNPLSAMTIATFADLGYTVNYATADPYRVR